MKDKNKNRFKVNKFFYIIIWKILCKKILKGV